MEMMGFVARTLAVVAIVLLVKTIPIVPQQTAVVIENLGKYSRTQSAGFCILARS